MMKDDDFKLLRGFADRRDRRTFVIVESLSRLKILPNLISLVICALGTFFPSLFFFTDILQWLLSYLVTMPRFQSISKSVARLPSLVSECCQAKICYMATLNIKYCLVIEMKIV